MAAKSGSEVASQGQKSASQKGPDAEKPTTSWVIPLITAVALALVFCAYYFVYVGAQREDLANRNFRALAVLGEQLQQSISIHSNILEFCANLADHNRQATHLTKEDLNQFLIVQPEDRHLPAKDREREALKNYLKYLAPTFELTEIPHNTNPKGVSRLQVERRSDRWELILTGFPHIGTDKDYQGSLRINELMAPLVGSLPFDDILLVSKEGTIVYQSKKIGPQFTKLSAILQAQTGAADSKQAGESTKPEAPSPPVQSEPQATPINENADRAWRTKSIHLTDVKLAGTQYKLFLQPVLVSTFNGVEAVNEAANEWVLCGLRSSAALDWESLSLSYTFFIWFTVAFLVIWTSYKVLKIFFMNQRERLRLRELGTLGLSLVLLTSVCTLSLLQFEFHVNDETEARLATLGGKLSRNLHDELGLMSAQLMDWCASPELQQKDFQTASGKEIIRNRMLKGSTPIGGGSVQPTPEPNQYPYVNNGFWTDDDGHQMIKWSMMQYVTPMIDVAQLAVYRRPSTHFVDVKFPPFNFVSILPPNKLEYLATLGMKTSACSPKSALAGMKDDVKGGSAFLSVQPLSLIDPILPFGYGFALVDQNGSVLFHSDKNRNGRENFLVESDGNKELHAAIFGRSNPRSLFIKYLGKDYRALVVPIQNISQAPWSLIVFRDLTAVRTLSLQIMTLASTQLFLILAGPVVFISIWYAIRRPRFAPEWLWPNQGRMRTYVDQIFQYSLLIILFLILCLWGSIEEILLGCAALPCAALGLTWWCFRKNRLPAGKSRPRTGSRVMAASATLSLFGVVVLLALVFLWTHLKALGVWLGFGMAATAPLLAKPRDYLIGRLGRWRAADAHAQPTPGGAERGFFTYKNCWAASVLLLLLLIGVLMPMALYRASLNVERRLGIKQAQWHLASTVARRWAAIVAQHENGELSDTAWRAFQDNQNCKTHVCPWLWIVPDGLTAADGTLPLEQHSAVSTELHKDWFLRLHYSLHHDYNESSAEMLGVIHDRGKPPDWSWENKASAITLRWHGTHPPAQKLAEDADPLVVQDDLLLTSPVRPFSWSDGVTYTGIAAAVMLAIGGLVLALARKVFLFGVAPMKMTGTRQVAESIREGKNILILLPPVSDWQLDATKYPIDLIEVAALPNWAETLDLSVLPPNTVIEIRHFEFRADDAEIDKQKCVLLDRLLKRENTQLAVVMTVPVSPKDYRRMFPALEVIDLREEPFPWLRQYEGPARDFIWKECGPMPALWPIGAQLAKDIDPDSRAVGRNRGVGNPGASRSLLPPDLERMFEGTEICALSVGGGWLAEPGQWKSHPATHT